MYDAKEFPPSGPRGLPVEGAPPPEIAAGHANAQNVRLFKA